MDWTSEAIDALRGYWAEGHSTAEIGRRMGISKNAVVGKAHRLNLPPRPSPIRREAAAPAPRVVQAVAPAQPPAQAPISAAPAQAPAPAPQPAVAQPAAMPARPVAPPQPAPVQAAAPTPPAPRPAAPPPARKPAPPAPQAVVRPFLRASARSCCWPIGEPGTPEFRFCTAQAMSGKPYCPEHAAVAYVKVRDRREDAA